MQEFEVEHMFSLKKELSDIKPYEFDKRHFRKLNERLAEKKETNTRILKLKKQS